MSKLFQLGLVMLVLSACAHGYDAGYAGGRAGFGGPNADVDQRTGFPFEAVVATAGEGDLTSVYFLSNRVDPALVSAAPTRICGAQGRAVRFTEITEPRADRAFPPFTRHLVVRCG